MDKVRLDFYQGVGGKVVVGDGFTYGDLQKTITEGEHAHRLSYPSCRGAEIKLASFTERENKGAQPVPDGFPVVVTFNDGGERQTTTSKILDWSVNDDPYSVVSWKPDYNKLLEMQKEHDAKQEKPIEELMINAKESKMSKNNKHPHHDLIVEWAKDTSKVVQVKNFITDGFSSSTIHYVVKDEDAEYEFRFKPREFQKGHWYPCIYSYGDIEVNMWNGEGFVSITNAIICSQPSEFMQIGESLGEIKFGGEE